MGFWSSNILKKEKNVLKNAGGMFLRKKDMFRPKLQIRNVNSDTLSPKCLKSQNILSEMHEIQILVKASLEFKIIKSNNDQTSSEIQR